VLLALLVNQSRLEIQYYHYYYYSVVLGQTTVGLSVSVHPTSRTLP